MEYSVHYNIDPSDLVETFVSYCVSHLNGAEPTLSILDDFERKILQKENGTAKKASTVNQQHRQPVEFDDYGNLGDSDDDEENDVMSAYICKTPKVIYCCASSTSTFFFWSVQANQIADNKKKKKEEEVLRLVAFGRRWRTLLKHKQLLILFMSAGIVSQYYCIL